LPFHPTLLLSIGILQIKNLTVVCFPPLLTILRESLFCFRELFVSKVLVTGGSGFVASRLILHLLAGGHDVRATVRTREREPNLRAGIRAGGADPDARLSIFFADLRNDAGWPEAVAGCDFVLHVASPLPAGVPKHEDDLVIPAREGALRVLRAARAAGVKRVVLTSSFAAVAYGRKSQKELFTEKDWTDPASHISVYAKSKTLAERAAWDFVEHEGAGLELSVINPVGVFGPLLTGDYSASILIVKRLLDGSAPGCPRLWFGIVDVRDLADIHILAMTHPAANGERFIATAGPFLSIVEMAKILKSNLGSAAAKARARELPDWLIRVGALFDPSLRQILPQLGILKNATSDKARRVLGWSPRPAEEALLATARSLLHFGVVNPGATTHH
jgi:nucleoside-diphosphate-sugar epimerase